MSARKKPPAAPAEKAKNKSEFGSGSGLGNMSCLEYYPRNWYSTPHHISISNHITLINTIEEAPGSPGLKAPLSPPGGKAASEEPKDATLSKDAVMEKMREHHQEMMRSSIRVCGQR